MRRKHGAGRSEVVFDAFLELLDLTEIDAGDVVQWERVQGKGYRPLSQCLA